MDEVEGKVEPVAWALVRWDGQLVFLGYKATDDYAPVYSAATLATLQSAIADKDAEIGQAVAAEREACAKAAEMTRSYDDNLQRSAGCATSGQRIAASIRARAALALSKKDETRG